MNLIFSEIYWGMTAVGRVQSEWTTLHATHCSHTSMNFEKNKIHFLNVADTSKSNKYVHV